MKRATTTIDALPFIWWILSGLVLGFLLGALVNFLIPVEYSSRAVLTSTEPPGPVTHLSVARSRWISEEIKGKESPEDIRERTTLQNTTEGLEIITRFSRREVARDIAHFAAKLVVSAEHEKNLADSSRPDPTLVKDSSILRSILTDQARKAGFIDFREVPVLASKGSEKAKTLLTDEDFNRRFTRYTEIVTKIGDWEHADLRSKSKIIVSPVTADEPTSVKYTEFLTSSAAYIGTLLGVAGGFLFARKPKVEQKPETGSASVFASSPADTGEW